MPNIKSLDLESVFQSIYGAFESFQSLHLSVTALMVIALILTLAFLFAVREAATWFFKVGDLKRDIKRLHSVSEQLENEVKTIQSLLNEMREPLKSAVESQTPSASGGQAQTVAQAVVPARPSAFPINH